jgi:uncharacterized protein YuzE
MKVQIHERADSIFFRLNDSEIIESEEVHPGIILDFDKRNEVVAIEVLRTKNRNRKKTTTTDPDKP